PRTIVVTNAPPIWIVLTTSTLAALVIASVASTSAVQPLVSIIPIASAMVFSGRVGIAHLWKRWAVPTLLFHGGGGASARRLLLGHHRAQLIVRARDDVNGDDGSDASRRLGAG